MLCKMLFHLSGTVVALHLENTAAKAFHTIKDVYCLFFFPDWYTAF